MKLPSFNADLTLDPKGRVMLPRALRDELDREGVFKLVAFANGGPGRGLAFCTVKAFEAMAAEHQGRGATDPKARLFALAIASTAQTVTIDRAGRMLVPAPLRKLLALERDLYLFTNGGWFELWDRTRWLEVALPEAAALWDDLYGFDSLRPGAAAEQA